MSQHFYIGLLLAIGGTFFFALKSIIIKLAYQEGANAEVLLTLRMIMALPFYLGMMLWLHRQQTLTQRLNTSVLIRVVAYGFLGYYLASYLDLLGLELISAQLERLTLFTYPAIVTLLSWLFLKEKLTWRIIVALVLCYLGVYLIYAYEQNNYANPDTLTGILLVLGAAVSYSLYVMLSKPMIHKLGSRLFTSIAMSSSSVFVLIQFILTQPLSALNVSWTIWFYGFLLAFVGTVIPSFMIAEAIGRIGASRTGILGTVGPVFTIALAVIILGEPFGWLHFSGMLLVLTGVWLIAKQD